MLSVSQILLFVSRDLGFYSSKNRFRIGILVYTIFIPRISVSSLEYPLAVNLGRPFEEKVSLWHLCYWRFEIE